MKMIMDYLTSFLLLSSILLIIINYWYRKLASNLPPGPFCLPIIGSIFQFGQNSQLSLLKLSQTYGPISYLKIGSSKTVVVSSPEMAKQILQKHDHICCDRFVPFVAQHEASISWLPVGTKWRTLRKISNQYMFTVNKLEATEGLRQEKMQQMCNYLQNCCENGGPSVNIGEVAFTTTLNLISTTLFSMDFASFDSNSSQEIKETINGIAKVTWIPNIADYFPIFKRIDSQGLKRSRDLRLYRGKLLAICDEIIGKRLEVRETSLDSTRTKDLLDVLLDLKQENDSDLSHIDIRNLLLEMIIAGTHTTANSVQWAITELLCNPEKLSKAKNELRRIIGNDKEIQECDIPKLSYLHAVIKESFRCHPAGLFLLPHKAKTNVEINGYMVPRDTKILVNLWAIGRDPKIWSNPNKFEPERFLGNKIDYKGQDFELLSFGSGRRICPGMPMAHLMVHLMVASFIHNFDWKLEQQMKPEELEMEGMLALALGEMVHLKVFPIKK